MAIEKLIKRCCICKSALIDGNLVPKRSYNPLEFQDKGFYFSDGILSKKCLVHQYGEEFAESLKSFNSLPESCPE